MNKKIILSLGVSALLISSLFAYSPQSGMKQGNGSSCKQHKMMKGQVHSKHRGHELIKMFMKLDLSDKQRTDIRAIIKKARANMPKPQTAFSNDSFDKAKFISLSNERRNAKIEHKAQVIGDIYQVLNTSQKRDFKTMLDMREIMKKNRVMR